MSHFRCNSLTITHFLAIQGVGVHVQKNGQTPLHLASLYGRLDIAQVLLDHRATTDLPDRFGRTPLHMVVEGTYNFEQDRIRTARLLLDLGADVNAQDEDNATPLHLASYDGRVETARFLLERDANPNSKDNQGRTPLHSVAEDRYLYSEDDGIRVVQLLLEHGADVNAQDEDNLSPLHVASYHGRVEIVRVLLDGGATTSLKGNQQQLHFPAPSSPIGWPNISTPLAITTLNHAFQCSICPKSFSRRQERERHQLVHLPCFLHCPLPHCEWRGTRIYVFKDHWQRGDHLSYHEQYGHAPERSQFETYDPRVILNQFNNGAISFSEAEGQAIVLVQRKAYELQKPSMGGNPWGRKRYWMTQGEAPGRPVQQSASTEGLISARGWTPLHVVAEGGDYDSGDDNDAVVARLLLERGADVNVPNDENQTPLHLACYFGRVKLVQILLDAGANVDMKDDQGQTALHVVSGGAYDSEEDGISVARLLVKHGADVNAQDNNHATPSYFASHYGRQMLELYYRDEADAIIDQAQILPPFPQSPRSLGLESLSLYDKPEYSPPSP